MAIPNPNPNIADGIKSDNKTYSSNKIESLITSSQIPIIGEGDEGKVVTVGDNGYELKTPVAPESIIDDTAAAVDTVYSSSKVDTLLSGKADNIELHTTLTHTTSGTVFNFDRAGDFIQISVNEDAQVQLPTSWASIGSLTTDYYTSGTGFTIIPFALVGGHQIDVRINKSNGTVEIQADTASNLWAQGLCVYHI